MPDGYLTGIGQGLGRFWQNLRQAAEAQQQREGVLEQRKRQAAIDELNRRVAESQLQQVQRQNIMEDRARQAQGLALGGGLVGDIGRTPEERMMKYGTDFDPLGYASAAALGFQTPEQKLLRDITLKQAGATPQKQQLQITTVGDQQGIVNLDTGEFQPLGASPAAVKAQAEETEMKEKTEKSKKQKLLKAKVVLNSIEKAKKLADEGTFTVGFGADWVSSIGGTDARNMKAAIDTITANSGFDTLQEMRDASPTGGALGQVSERELTLLMAAKGSLDQSQSKEQFLQNLHQYEVTMLNFVHGEGNWIKDKDGKVKTGQGIGAGVSQYSPPEQAQQAVDFVFDPATGSFSSPFKE